MDATVSCFVCTNNILARLRKILTRREVSLKAGERRKAESAHCEVHSTVPEEQVQQRTEAADLGPLRERVARGLGQLEPERLPGEEFVQHERKEDRCAMPVKSLANFRERFRARILTCDGTIDDPRPKGVPERHLRERVASGDREVRGARHDRDRASLHDADRY